MSHPPGKVTDHGVLRPVSPVVCDLMLAGLAQQGVAMVETTTVL